MYDGRVDLPRHDQLELELASLERDERTGKVDHAPHGAKDLADALAGVVFGLSQRREVWVQHGVNPFEAAPAYVGLVCQADDDRAAGRSGAGSSSPLTSADLNIVPLTPGGTPGDAR